MVLPYCGSHETECFRGVVLGVLSVCFSAIGGLALVRVSRAHLRGVDVYVNLAMLGLVEVQSAILAVKFMIARHPRLTFTAGYMRGVQVLMSCALFAIASLKEFGEVGLIGAQYWPPILVTALIYLSILYIVSMAQRDLDCYSATHFLLMSISQVVIVMLFSIPILRVLKGLSESIGRSRASISTILIGEEVGGDIGAPMRIVQQRRGVTILLVSNVAASITQLALDSWQNVYSDDQNCVVFETGLEEMIRLFLEVIAYYLPVASTIWVYYYLPRRDFESGLEVRFPNAQIELEDAFRADDDTAYERFEEAAIEPE